MSNGTVICLRERGGAGDILCTFPAVRQLAQDGYRVLYVIDHQYRDWASLSPYLETVNLPIGVLNLTQSPFREADYLDEIVKHVPGLVLEEVDHVVNFFCPAWALERVYTAFRIIPPLSRPEIYWLAAGYRLPDMPPDPMAGTLNVPPVPMERTQPYYVVQAHSDAPDARLMPVEQVARRVAHDTARERVPQCFIIGQFRPLVDAMQRAIYGSVALYTLPTDDLVNLCSRAERIYTPDSALLHLAAACGVPSVSWFSCTDGQTICRPYPMAEYVQADCWPCWRYPIALRYHGRPECQDGCCHARFL